MAVVQAAGDQVVACAFRRRAGHEGGLDFLEAVLVQVGAHHLAGAMAQAQVALHASASEVKIAIAQASLFARLRLILDGERWRLRFVQNQEGARYHFHFAGSKCGIHRSRRAHYDFSLHPHYVFGTNLLRAVMHGTADSGIANNLRPARMVTQIKEDQIAEVAADIHPASQKNGLPRVLFAQLTAIVRPLSITKKI